MKIAFLYGPFCLGGENGFPFADLWTNPRGLTGSELSYFQISREMARRGHDVSLYTFSQKPVPEIWEGMRIRNLHTFQSEASLFDVVYSWNEPELFRDVRTDALKMVNLQINSFTHCRSKFDDFVDVWTSPSEEHRKRILREVHPVAHDFLINGTPYAPDPSKWVVVTNGCDVDQYSRVSQDVARVPGRVIWASSPDRGLHRLLQIWPRIRREIPHAHLRIFYKIDSWFAALLEHPDPVDDDIRETRARARYVHEALRRLNGHGIELMKSVSREQIEREMASSEVLAYPCDTVNWTEGFSVTLMEACAAGTIPVTTDVDALGSIYGGSVPMVRSPVGERIEEFAELVIRALRDPQYRDEVRSRTVALARSYSWSAITDQLESVIKERRCLAS